MEDKIITIYYGNPIDAEVVTEILNDNGITATMKNHLMGTIAPWYVSAGGTDPVEVQIMKKDQEKAIKLVKEFEGQ